MTFTPILISPTRTICFNTTSARHNGLNGISKDGKFHCNDAVVVSVLSVSVKISHVCQIKWITCIGRKIVKVVAIKSTVRYFDL